MEELICKPVPSKPGFLAYSDGTIQLPEVTAALPNGGFRVYKTKPIKGTISKANKKARHVYYRTFNRKLGNIKVHRIVCEAFHGAPPNPRSVVIHIDENGLNNKPENLKWGTQKENLNAPGFIKYCKSRTGDNSPAVKGLKNKLTCN